jgi:hypothetical protein
MPAQAPMFPINYTSDGVKTTYDLGFDYLDKSDIRVIVNGVIKTLGTDYAIVTKNRDSGYDSIRFINIPANGQTIKFFRNTSIALRKPSLEMGQLVALQALYREQERNDARRQVQRYVPQATLLAKTTQYIDAPCDGYLEVLRVRVVDAAIGTGANVSIGVEGSAPGLTVAVASSAAIGTLYEDLPATAQSAATKVRKGQRIEVLFGAAFATSGAVEVTVDIQPADLD